MTMDTRSRLRQTALPLVVTLGLLVVAIAAPEVTRSAFTSSTSTTAALDTPTLQGLNAPLAGVDSFAATPTATGCDLSWTALAGGTTAADRFEVVQEPSGTSLFETSDVLAGAQIDATTTAVSSYRLRTRAASTWVSPVEETTTTTCVRPGQVAVSAGDTATCGIRSNETLWCWGFGQRLTPGNDTFLTTSTPVFESGAAWRQVDVAVGHGCGLQTDGTLWCWGDNWIGQLGNGTTTESTDPVQVGLATDWVSVEVFGYTTCGLRSIGTLWCWGRNDYGQMGDGTNTASSTPIQIGAATDWVSVAGGQRHACGVRSNDMWCWGQNIDGELGDGTGTTRTSPVQVGDSGVWSASLGLGEQHSCAVQTDSTLWCWGTNWFGEQGRQSSSQRRTPGQVGADSNWAQVSAGDYFTCATRIDQTLWCTGTNLNGRTGLGLTSGRTEILTQVGSSSTWSLISLGSEHVCAVRTDASMWCWGSNNVGQVGQPDATWQSPQPVNAELDWTEVQAGYNHTCGLKTDRSLWCWGENSNAQLGLNQSNDGFSEPTEVANTGQWIALGAGDFHTCGIMLDGTLWCWGRNSSGQLGTGDTTESAAPIQVGIDVDWTSLGSGRSHNCAIKTTGTMWCWGENSAGTIGDGTTNDALSPVQIGSETNWSNVDAGFRHTCGVRTDRSLWCWGSNGNGQVGDGSWVDQVVPTRVGTDTDWLNVGSGRDHNCAVKTAGTLWCWGRGTEGQVGDGGTGTQPAPVQAGTATDWSSADGANNYSCARRTDDSLWCWGRNAAGNFGNGTVGGITTSPIQVNSGLVAFTVSTGHWHTCGIDTSGLMLCWGANYSGQLGYNTSVSVPNEVDGAYAWSQ